MQNHRTRPVAPEVTQQLKEETEQHREAAYRARLYAEGKGYTSGWGHVCDGNGQTGVQPARNSSLATDPSDAAVDTSYACVCLKRRRRDPAVPMRTVPSSSSDIGSGT